MSKQTFALSINGADRSAFVDPEMPLLWVLRDNLDLTGTKFGCGAGLCGACTVLLDGDPVRSCQVSVGDTEGSEITTIEGITGPVVAAVRAAWVAQDVVQCGYCQSGQILAATALLTETPVPEREDIDVAMNGNLCRCGSYQRIRNAIFDASQALKEV